MVPYGLNPRAPILLGSNTRNPLINVAFRACRVVLFYKTLGCRPEILLKLWPINP